MSQNGPSAAGTTATGRMGLSRRGWLLLVASLALNLLALGAIASAAFIRRHGGYEPVFAGAAMAPGEMFGFVRSLPPERRRAIRQQVMSERPILKALRASVTAARDDVGRYLVADPLDRAALADATSKLWTAEGNLRRKQLDLMAQMSSVMTKEERAKFVAKRQSRWTRMSAPGGRGADGRGADGADEPDTDRDSEKGSQKQ
ncbi:MAG: periplasmic heavy metal sensor [Hyphomicrobium aestuarii]|nr:periplasmic heavy metal sensor [Hyphomicrobium aestuarii]